MAARRGCERVHAPAGPRRRRARPGGIGGGWRRAPTFDNQFATLELDGRSAVLRIERTVRDEADNRGIETSLERKLA